MMQANFSTVRDVANTLVACKTCQELCQVVLARYEEVSHY